MKLLHISDLHIGKSIFEHSLMEDQKYILQEILEITDAEQPDAVLIAGDVYDRTIPSAEAVKLFDDFLVSLAKRRLQVFIISGNHDSPERLSFGNRLIDLSGVHIAPVWQGEVQPFTLTDDHGPVHVYMLPFVKPLLVKHYFPDAELSNYTDAIRVAVEQMAPDFSDRNILLSHQYVTDAVRSDSEERVVGGLDNVDASAYGGFDYVALGHIHMPQNVGGGVIPGSSPDSNFSAIPDSSPDSNPGTIPGSIIRYSGTPLKYAFSETTEKSVTIVELGEKGSLEVREVPLKPLRDMVTITGKSFAEVTDPAFYRGEGKALTEAYVRIVLKDEEELPNAMSRLRLVYPYILNMNYDNARTNAAGVSGQAADVETQSPEELFGEMFLKMNGSEMTEEQSTYLRTLMEEIWNDDGREEN